MIIKKGPQSSAFDKFWKNLSENLDFKDPFSPNANIIYLDKFYIL